MARRRKASRQSPQGDCFPPERPPLAGGRPGVAMTASLGSADMARVHFSGEAARRFTGGLTEIEVEANNFRRMVLELDRRFPGLGRQVEEGMAAAIDGEIFQDAYLAPLKPDSEVYLIPKIGGGQLGAPRPDHSSGT